MTDLPGHAIHFTNLPARYQAVADDTGEVHIVDTFEPQWGKPVSEIESMPLRTACDLATVVIGDQCPEYVTCRECYVIAR